MKTGLEGSVTSTQGVNTGSRISLTCHLVHIRRNKLSEGISGPVETRFYRSQITVGDLRNLLVRLAFELAQNEHISVMFRQLGHRILYDFSQVALPVHVVRSRC